MSEWLFTIRRRFTPDLPGWYSYVEFSGFNNIRELITLDSMLCPNTISELRDADWIHNVHEDWKTELFYNSEYLTARDGFDPKTEHVLGIIQSPKRPRSTMKNFESCGFDIMDSYFGNSTLTNCGQIPEAFSPSVVNRYGLIEDLDEACGIRDRMRQLQPDDPHLGNCDVWQISRRR